MNIIISLWRAMRHYRGFILGTVKRDFQLRYQGSLFGMLWTILQPLSMIFVYTVIFAHLMRMRLAGMDSTFAYSIYLCSGVITWSLFTDIVTRSNTVFIDNANLIKKSNFPKICLPLITVFSSLINFFIILALFLGFLLISGNWPHLVVLGIIPIIFLEVLFAIGLGVFLGTLNVFFRDVGQVTSVMLQFWFWATPIVYPIAIVHGFAKHIIEYNPMSVMIAAYQRIFVNQQWPEWNGILIFAAIAFGMLTVGLLVFQRNAHEIVDEL